MSSIQTAIKKQSGYQPPTHSIPLSARGLDELVTTCKNLGIENFAHWDEKSDIYKICIPYTEQQKKIVEAHIEFAKKNHLIVRIEKTQASGKEISLLSIGDIIIPGKDIAAEDLKETDLIHSAFNLSRALDKKEYQPLLDTVKKAFFSIHQPDRILENSPMPESGFYKNWKCLDFEGSCDAADFCKSNTPISYRTESRAALAVPHHILKPEELNDLLNLINDFVEMNKKCGAIEGTFKVGKNSATVVQVELAHRQKLINFAESIGFYLNAS
jgi:hypothetical protein